MATVWHLTKGLKDGRANQFSSADGWIHDLSNVSGPIKYWKDVAGAAVMMNQAERDAVDAQEVLDFRAADRIANKLRIDNEKVLKALAWVTMDGLNVLRSQHALAAITSPEMITQIKAKVDILNG